MTPFYIFIAFSAVLWLAQLIKNKKKADRQEGAALRKNAQKAADAARAEEIGQILDRALKTKEVQRDAGAKSREIRKVTDIRKWAQGMALEDDEHDWLAQQMREEAQAYKRVSEMFQLKISHAANCQAEKLRQEHEENCDAAALRRKSAQ